MSSTTARPTLIGVLAATCLAACGGGGGGSSTAGIDGTGITGPTPPSASPAVAVGAVTAFGSVIVNGVRFDTSTAEFTIDGQSGRQDDLSVGDVVIVVGTVDDSDPTAGTASSVVFDDVVEGPIGAVHADTSTLVVMGQTVTVDAATSFDDSVQPPSLAGLTPGQVIEVSGLIRSDGGIAATRIEPKPASTEWEVTGRVASHDSGALTFVINALTVDYGTAMVEDFPTGTISDGDIVEVKGATTLGPGSELIATRVEFKGNRVNGATGDRLEVEGFVTRFGDATDFDVSGVPTTTNAQTVFVGGVAGDLGLDTKVEVEGTINASGVLVATKVDIRRARAVRLFAAVDSTAGAAGTGAAAGTGSLLALGITIDVDSLTRREDKTDLDVSPFGVADLSVGDFVEVRGTESPPGSGRILAGLLERDDPDDSELQGFVTAALEPEITILGVTVITTGAQFRNVSGDPITPAQFFADLVVASGADAGSLVKVKGVETGPQTITASEVEFELAP